MSNGASLRSEFMVLFRPLESSRPERSRLFCDPLAAIFLHQWRKWLYGLAQLDVGRRLVEKLFDRNAPGARAAGIARTKWIDEEVTRALEGVTQLVLLGAGFETRPYRLPVAQRVTTFELDHPETSGSSPTSSISAPVPMAFQLPAPDSAVTLVFECKGSGAGKLETLNQ
jgi:methyltransferase (TIGR00027 family)